MSLNNWADAKPVSPVRLAVPGQLSCASLMQASLPKAVKHLGSVTLKPPLAAKLVTFTGKPMRKEGERKYSVLPATEERKQFLLLALGSMIHSAACQFGLSQRASCLMCFPHLLFGLHVHGQNL